MYVGAEPVHETFFRAVLDGDIVVQCHLTEIDELLAMWRIVSLDVDEAAARDFQAGFLADFTGDTDLRCFVVVEAWPSRAARWSARSSPR